MRRCGAASAGRRCAEAAAAFMSWPAILRERARICEQDRRDRKLERPSRASGTHSAQLRRTRSSALWQAVEAPPRPSASCGAALAALERLGRSAGTDQTPRRGAKAFQPVGCRCSSSAGAAHRQRSRAMGGRCPLPPWAGPGASEDPRGPASPLPTVIPRRSLGFPTLDFRVGMPRSGGWPPPPPPARATPLRDLGSKNGTTLGGLVAGLVALPLTAGRAGPGPARQPACRRGPRNGALELEVRRGFRKAGYAPSSVRAALAAAVFPGRRGPAMAAAPALRSRPHGRPALELRLNGKRARRVQLLRGDQLTCGSGLEVR